MQEFGFVFVFLSHHLLIQFLNVRQVVFILRPLAEILLGFPEGIWVASFRLTVLLASFTMGLVVTTHYKVLHAHLFFAHSLDVHEEALAEGLD